MTGSAHAQTDIDPPPTYKTVDQFGVDPSSGSVQISSPTISIGDPAMGGLSFTASWDSAARHWRPSVWGGIDKETLGSDPYCYRYYTLTFMGSSNIYQPNGCGGPFFLMDGVGTLSKSGNIFTYTLPDGTIATYDYSKRLGSGARFKARQALITSIVKPDGEVITYTYNGGAILSISNNLGYQLHFDYVSGGMGKVTAFDTAVDPCAPTATTCAFSAVWPSLTFTYSGAERHVTDALGRTTRFIFDSSDMLTAKLIGVARPTTTSGASVSYTQTKFTDGATRVTSVNSGAGIWQYRYTWSDCTPSLPGWVPPVICPRAQEDYYFTTIVTDPYGGETAYTSSWDCHDFDEQYTTAFVSIKNPLGYTTTRVQDGSGFVASSTPDGDGVQVERDSSTSVVTRIIRNPKPGSPLVNAVTAATYPTCTSNPLICRRPISITDSAGRVTAYTYDPTHGGVLSETRPAPGWGPYSTVQPQTRYSYGDNGSGIYRVATAKSCRTTASCAGTADETVVETTYDAKRRPTLVVTRAGNNSAAYTSTNMRVSTTYALQGDVASIDGPLSGAADTVWTYYDVMRQPRVTITTDPDGGGSLLYLATRTTYNADGQVTMVEQGSVSAPANCSSVNNFCASTMTVLAKTTTDYDVLGRKVRDNIINLGTNLPQAVTQYSYDAMSRSDCVAQRMNQAVYSALPGACAQSTAGTFGPDRIVRTTYDANSAPLLTRSGYGTPLVRNERAFTYTPADRVATVKDAANNLTTYSYDGFNRLIQTRYPLKDPVGAGLSAPTSGPTADYEQLTYDVAGNVFTERRRDGLTIANTWDNLDRLRLIDRPGSELDVTNSYDNFAQLVSAADGVNTVSWAYDALGRVLSEVQPNGTVSYAYNTAGQRTQLTYPGAGFYTNYQYFDDGRLRLIGLNGATSGAGVLATFYDDQMGRRSYVCRGPDPSATCNSSGYAATGYAYDAASRLATLAHSLVTGGGASNYWVTFTYSPASQLTYRQSFNAAYDWSYSAAFSDAYTTNGLNQYTAIAGVSLAHDGRGNTTNDTTKAYLYDSLNRLTWASNGAVLTYDPTGRLLSIAQGGATTRFLYDGTRLIAEYDGAGALLRRYVHGDGVDDPLVWYDSNSTANKRNLFKDERGSVIAADTSSTVYQKRYDEYGNADGAYTGRFQYTGQTWLSEIGLNYYKARVYNPDIGRFMQTDPIGYQDQINLYTYGGNDPLNRSDPTGETAVALSGACGPAALLCLGAGLVATCALSDACRGAASEGAAAAGRAIGDAWNGVFQSEQAPDDRRRGSRPTDAPRGTRPIDKSGIDRDGVHGIKDGIGARPDDWVGITPDGGIVTTDPQTGRAVDQGNVSDHDVERERERDPKGGRDRRRDS